MHPCEWNYNSVALEPGGGNNCENVILKNCAPFTDQISEINNMQVDNAKDIDIVMPMHI